VCFTKQIGAFSLNFTLTIYNNVFKIKLHDYIKLIPKQILFLLAQKNTAVRGSMSFKNVGNGLPDYMTSHPRIQASQQSPLPDAMEQSQFYIKLRLVQ
jgi:hypothetical protein